MTQEQAVKLIEKCLKVLFYRDARSLNRVRRNVDGLGLMPLRPGRRRRARARLILLLFFPSPSLSRSLRFPL